MHKIGSGVAGHRTRCEAEEIFGEEMPVQESADVQHEAAERLAEEDEEAAEELAAEEDSR